MKTLMNITFSLLFLCLVSPLAAQQQDLGERNDDGTPRTEVKVQQEAPVVAPVSTNRLANELRTEDGRPLSEVEETQEMPAPAAVSPNRIPNELRTEDGRPLNAVEVAAEPVQPASEQRQAVQMMYDDYGNEIGPKPVRARNTTPDPVGNFDDYGNPIQVAPVVRTTSSEPEVEEDGTDGTGVMPVPYQPARKQQPVITRTATGELIGTVPVEQPLPVSPEYLNRDRSQLNEMGEPISSQPAPAAIPSPENVTVPANLDKSQRSETGEAIEK